MEDFILSSNLALEKSSQTTLGGSMNSFTGTMIMFFVGMSIAIWHLVVLFRGTARWKDKDPYDPNV